MDHILTLSSSGHLTIPREVVEQAGWGPGTKLVPVVKGETLELVRVDALEELRGFIKGTAIGPIRDHDDRY